MGLRLVEVLTEADCTGHPADWHLALKADTWAAF